MLKRLHRPAALLAAATLVFLLTACRTEPEIAAPRATFQFAIDPIGGTVQPTALAPQRVLVPGAELALADFGFAFAPGDLLVIEASFENTSPDLKYRDFTFIPGGSGYLRSSEPVLANGQLGTDELLTPSETTPLLRFEVVHAGAPFTYVVSVDADVIQIPDDLGDPEGLSGNPLLVPEEGNCTVDELVTREQGFRLSGGVGGLGIDDPAGPFTLSPVVAAANLAAQITAVVGDVQLERDVGILVVDDFDPSALDALVFELGAADLDPGVPDPFDALDQLLDDLVAAGKLSHGPLVLLHTIALLAALPDMSLDQVDDNLILLTKDGHSIAVVPVDTQGFRTSVIPEAIRQSLEGLLNTLPTMTDLVVNMSFNVIPCSLLTDFGASGAASFDEYIALLAAANDLVGLEAELAELVTTAFLPDPLRDLTEDLPLVERTIFVGSAGNFGNDFVNRFTLAPALWPNVVGVASLDGTSNVPSRFANPGEVAFGGAWIVLEDALGSTFTGLAPFTRVAGSSFAAPGVSVFSALDLASSARCAPEPVDDPQTPEDESRMPKLATGVAGYGENALALAVARSCDPKPDPTSPMFRRPTPRGRLGGSS